MKITSVTAYQPPTPGAPPDWRTQLGQIIVEVATDEGLVGYGVGGGGAAGIHIVESVLREFLIGQSPEPVEEIHASLCEHTAFYGIKGVTVMALSGVDLALWDLRGKVLDTPVARLLNSALELPKTIPTYVTAFGGDSIEQALAEGHKAL